MKFNLEMRERVRMAQANTEAANAHEAARAVRKLHGARYDVLSVRADGPDVDPEIAADEHVIAHWCEACELPIFEGEQSYFGEDGGVCVCEACGKDAEGEA